MGKTLTIFDFDDTLIHSNANIGITHKDGTIETLSSEEYASYSEKLGDVFNFSEFDEYPKNAKIIGPSFQKLKSAITGAGDVVILTARSNPKPVEDFLKNNGVRGVEIVGVGSSDPMSKARFVLNKLKLEHYDLVHVYEDNFRNIRAIKKVVADTGIKFQSTKVAAGKLLENNSLLRNTIKELFSS